MSCGVTYTSTTTAGGWFPGPPEVPDEEPLLSNVVVDVASVSVAMPVVEVPPAVAVSPVSPLDPSVPDAVAVASLHARSLPSTQVLPKLQPGTTNRPRQDHTEMRAIMTSQIQWRGRPRTGPTKIATSAAAIGKVGHVGAPCAPPGPAGGVCRAGTRRRKCRRRLWALRESPPAPKVTQSMTASLAALDERFMGLALEVARQAAARGDVPVGAIVVQRGAVTGVGFNRRETDADPSAHAEIVALREACRAAGRWRIDGATLYATLEPCPMCAGALVNARVARLVYGAPDPKAGAVRSLFRVCDDDRLNHRLKVVEGVLADSCAQVLREFFAARRHPTSTASGQELG